MYVYVIRCVIKRIFSSTFLGLSKEITIIEGSLNDEVKIDEALEAVTSVVCWIV